MMPQCDRFSLILNHVIPVTLFQSRTIWTNQTASYDLAVANQIVVHDTDLNGDFGEQLRGHVEG